MKNIWYILYAMILGVVSFFTGEIVTYIMLGMILIALININNTLKKLYIHRNEQNSDNVN